MKNNNETAANAPLERGISRKNLSDLFCKFNGKRYICSALHSDRRGKLAKIAGIFYARSYRFHTPLQCVNAPAAGHGVEQRVGMKPFYSYAVNF